jgi:hypothetical protein
MFVRRGEPWSRPADIQRRTLDSTTGLQLRLSIDIRGGENGLEQVLRSLLDRQLCTSFSRFTENPETVLIFLIGFDRDGQLLRGKIRVRQDLEVLVGISLLLRIPGR